MDTPGYVILSRLGAQQRATQVLANNLANADTPGFQAQRPIFARFLQPPRRRRAARPGHRLQRRPRHLAGHAAGPADHHRQPAGRRAARRRLLRGGDCRGRGALHPRRPLHPGPDGRAGGCGGQCGAGHPRRAHHGRPGRQPHRDPGRRHHPVREWRRSASCAWCGSRRRSGCAPKGDRLFAADETPLPMDRPGVVQGAVEGSNVSPVMEMVRMTEEVREFQNAVELRRPRGRAAAERAVERILRKRS